jgi:hypothetical protein
MTVTPYRGGRSFLFAKKITNVITTAKNAMNMDDR